MSRPTMSIQADPSVRTISMDAMRRRLEEAPDPVTVALGARLLGVEKVTLLTAIRRGSIESERDPNGWHLIRRAHLLKYHAQRARGGPSRAQMMAWADGKDPSSPPDGVNPIDWEMLLAYAGDEYMSVRDLGVEYGMSRQRAHQRIGRARRSLGLL